MTRRVDSNLLYELKDFGAISPEACFNCGNCTAICPMSTDDSQFPRRIIRMAQLGLKEDLLGSKELWLCYNCGECSETCPKQAEPGNLMMAARSYAISNYSPFKIGQLFSTKPVFGGLLAALMVLFFGFFMYSEHQIMATDSLKLFGFIPYEFIHVLGLSVMILIAVIALMTIYKMISSIGKANDLSFKQFFKGSQMNWFKAFWEALVVQALLQKRYREDCETTDDTKFWFLSKWFVHAATMWGFLGLLLATVLDYLLDIIGVKPTGTFVPIWYPTRLIGTLSGLLFLFGISILLYRRIRPTKKSYSNSLFSDWLFLTLLGLAGLTGFIVEIALYLPGAPMWGYWIFIFHVSVSITLILLLPFTKFAHAIYRTVALYVYNLKPLPEQEAVPASAN